MRSSEPFASGWRFPNGRLLSSGTAGEVAAVAHWAGCRAVRVRSGVEGPGTVTVEILSPSGPDAHRLVDPLLLFLDPKPRGGGEGLLPIGVRLFVVTHEGPPDVDGEPPTVPDAGFLSLIRQWGKAWGGYPNERGMAV